MKTKGLLAQKKRRLFFPLSQQGLRITAGQETIDGVFDLESGRSVLKPGGCPRSRRQTLKFFAGVSEVRLR